MGRFRSFLNRCITWLLRRLGVEVVTVEELHRQLGGQAKRLVEQDAEINRLGDELARREALAAAVREGVARTMTFRAHEAAEMAAREGSRPEGPPTAADDPEISTLPAFDIGEWDAITAAFHAREAVLVRKVVPADWIEGYRARIERYVACVVDADAAGSDSEKVRNLVATFRAQSGLDLSSRNDETLPIPAGIRNFLNPLKASGIVDCARRFFGSELFFMPDYSSVRCQRPDEGGKALAWHQDGAAVGYVSGDPRGIVFWMPLTRIGDDTPGLEIVARKCRTLWPHVSTSAGYNQIADGARIDAEYGDAVVAVPPMDLGDVLIFSFNTIHRTRVAPGMTKPRYSLDIRAVPLLDVPWQYKGWLVIP